MARAANALGAISRATIRLIVAPVVSALTFLLGELSLGYLVIQVLRLHRPYPAANESTVLLVALNVTVPLVFGLTALGLVLSWSALRTIATGRLLVNVASGGLVSAVLFTLEDLPRRWGAWLALLPAVAVVVVILLLMRRSAPRAARVSTAG
jgi:hypothetical protein